MSVGQEVNNTEKACVSLTSQEIKCQSTVMEHAYNLSFPRNEAGGLSWVWEQHDPYVRLNSAGLQQEPVLKPTTLNKSQAVSHSAQLTEDSFFFFWKQGSMVIISASPTQKLSRQELHEALQSQIQVNLSCFSSLISRKFLLKSAMIPEKRRD